MIGFRTMDRIQVRFEVSIGVRIEVRTMDTIEVRIEVRTMD